MRTWLQDFRIQKKLTQKEVAEKVAIATTTYASYEQGTRNPSVKNAKEIAKLLGFDWLIFFDNNYTKRVI